MNSDDLYKAVGNIDESFISEAAGSVRKIRESGLYLSDMYRSGNEGAVEVKHVKNRKGIKIIAVAVAAAVAAGAAAAAIFGTKKDKKIYKEKQITNYFREERKLMMPEGTYGISEGIFGNEELLYIPAYMSTAEERPFAAQYGLSNGSCREFDLSEYGFSGGQVYAGERYLYFTVWGSDETTTLVRVGRNSAEIVDAVVQPKNEWIADINENEDGSAEVIKYILTDGEISDYLICTYDSGFNETGRVNVIDSRLLEDHLFFGYLTDKQGVSYAFYKDYEDSLDMYRYSADGELEYSKTDIASDMPGAPLRVFLSAEDIPCVMTCDNLSVNKSNFYINEYDPQTGETSGRFDSDLDGRCNGGWINVMEADSVEYEKYDIVFNESGRIYGYEMKFDEVTELFSSEQLNIGSEDQSSFNYAVISGDEVIVSGNTVTEGSSSGNRVIVTDPEGNDFSFIDVPGSIRYVRDSADGLVMVLYTEWDEELYRSNYRMLKADRSGNIIGKYEFEYDNEMYCERFISFDNGITVLSDMGSVLFFNGDGKFIKKNDIDGYNIRFFSSGNGSYVCFNTDNGVQIKKLGFEDQTLSDVCSLEIKARDVFDGFGSYDAVFSLSDGLYGYTISSDTMEEIINWADSDMTRDDYIHVFGPDLIASYSHVRYGQGYDEDLSVKVIRRAGDDVLAKIQQRKVITVAVSDWTENIGVVAAKFNSENENCRIHLEDYTKYAAQGVSVLNDSGTAKLSDDIISGNIPDVIIFTDSFSRGRFFGEGVFEDLNRYIEKDSDISRSDLFENIADVYLYEGKQYSIPLTFGLISMIGKNDVIGGENELTYKKMAEIAEERDLFAYMTYDQIMAYLIAMNIDEFVDFSAGTCSFESERFINIINTVKQYGVSDEKLNEILYDESEYNKMLSRLYNDLCALDVREIWRFDDYRDIQQFYKAIDPCLAGCPGDEKSGPMVTSDMIVSIFSASPNKEEAWSFVKMLLSDEGQTELTTLNGYFVNSFPINMSAYDSNAQKVLNSSDNACYNSVDITGTQYRERKVSADDVEYVTAAAGSVTRAVSSDLDIQKIINEQLDIFIGDGQTAEETAKNIQKKVSIYLKEIK